MRIFASCWLGSKPFNFGSEYFTRLLHFLTSTLYIQFPKFLADYFNIRGEKDDRTGNVKADLNIGVDNQRIGVTANVGYDTKGHNVRAGIGLRVIF